MKFKTGMWTRNHDQNALDYNSYLYLSDLKTRNGLPFFDVVFFDAREGGKAKYRAEWGVPKTPFKWGVYHPTETDYQKVVMAVFGGLE
jgi:hypothetical protein